MYEFTEGKKVDALIKDLHGTVVTRVRAVKADTLAQEFHEIAWIVERALSAEKSLKNAIRKLEFTVDNL